MSPLWIVTAAHCFGYTGDPDQYGIVAGEKINSKLKQRRSVLLTLVMLVNTVLLQVNRNRKLNPLISNIVLQILLSCCHTLLIAYRRDGTNFLIDQRSSCSVIISFILMTFLTERVLILQREI